MFIYSVRASSVKFFIVVALTLAVFIGVLFASETAIAASGAEINFSGIKTEEDRIAFIESFGVCVEGAEEEVSFVLPDNFDRVMLGYNEIQKDQGLDLSKYAKKKVTRYTYTLKDYNEYDGEVYVNLLVYRGRVIGCDVSSADPEGFVEPLIK